MDACMDYAPDARRLWTVAMAPCGTSLDLRVGDQCRSWWRFHQKMNDCAEVEDMPDAQMWTALIDGRATNMPKHLAPLSRGCRIEVSGERHEFSASSSRQLAAVMLYRWSWAIGFDGSAVAEVVRAGSDVLSVLGAVLQVTGGNSREWPASTHAYAEAALHYRDIETMTNRLIDLSALLNGDDGMLAKGVFEEVVSVAVRIARGEVVALEYA